MPIYFSEHAIWERIVTYLQAQNLSQRRIVIIHVHKYKISIHQSLPPPILACNLRRRSCIYPIVAQTIKGVKFKHAPGIRTVSDQLLMLLQCPVHWLSKQFYDNNTLMLQAMPSISLALKACFAHEVWGYEEYYIFVIFGGSLGLDSLTICVPCQLYTIL